MVVDDELEMVKVVRGMLKEKGFNVTCAYDGTQVFDVLKQQKPDLVILDILMPQMDGLEVLTRLKDKYKRTLAYVFLQDGTFLNAEIVKQGYGHAYTRFPFKYLDEFRRYEREAREQRRGLYRLSTEGS